jgi:hypothetical protein
MCRGETERNVACDISRGAFVRRTVFIERYFSLTSLLLLLLLLLSLALSLVFTP